MQLPYYIAALLVGMLCHSAGVHQEYIRSLAPRHSLESGLGQLAFVGGSLGVIQLASKCYICYLLVHLYKVILDHWTTPFIGGLFFDTRTEKLSNCGNLSSNALTIRPATCSSRSDGFAISSATTS